MFETLIREWDGEFVATRFDAPSGAWMFVGVHSTALGPGFGGTRMKVYDAAGGRARRRAPALRGHDVQERDGRSAVRRREVGPGRARHPARRRTDVHAPAIRGLRRVARRELRDRVRHEHHRGGHGRGGGAVPARDGPKRRRRRVRHVGARHRDRRLPRDPREPGARVRLGRSERQDDRRRGCGRGRWSALRPAGRGRREARGVRHRRRASACRRGAGGRRHRGSAGGVRRRVRPVLAVRDGSGAQRRHDPAPAMSGRGRSGEQPAGGAGRRRPSGGRRHPVRPRLRGERRRRPAPGGLRTPRLDRRRDDRPSGGDRRHAHAGVRRRRCGRRHAAGGGGPDGERTDRAEGER